MSDCNHEVEETEETESLVSCINDLGIFTLWGEINEHSSKEVCDWIIYNNISPVHEKLSIVINSGGGILADTYSIIDTIKSSKLPIDTYGLGMVGSGALMIFLTGKNRILAPNTLLLSHELAGNVDGGATKMISESSHIGWMYDQMVKHYKECTNLSDKKIRTCLLPPHKDVYIKPEEALKYKICTHIGYLNYP